MEALLEIPTHQLQTSLYMLFGHQLFMLLLTTEMVDLELLQELQTITPMVQVRSRFPLWELLSKPVIHS